MNTDLHASKAFPMNITAVLPPATFAILMLSAPAYAQTNAAEHAGHHPVAAASAPASALADGEVRKIDKEQGKLTLKHGPIANLEMPGMTMVFKVADAKMLDGVKAGDKVRFAADRVNGAITVTAIEVVK
jgi:Cu(I)/Ag(I) efflux system periplasmic protein CusF